MKICKKCLASTSEDLCSQCNTPTHEWVIHLVNNKYCEVHGETVDLAPYEVNAHTHGLFENYGHLDIQIVMPLGADLISSLLNSICERIKEGTRFSHGQIDSDVLEHLDVLFLEAKESQSVDRTLLRMILPDTLGILDRDTMESDFYKKQYKGVISK